MRPILLFFSWYPSIKKIKTMQNLPHYNYYIVRYLNEMVLTYSRLIELPTVHRYSLKFSIKLLHSNSEKYSCPGRRFLRTTQEFLILMTIGFQSTDVSSYFLFLCLSFSDIFCKIFFFNSAINASVRSYPVGPPFFAIFEREWS
jgi:hypothetical protein